jgi:hypothetical protein
MGLLFLIKDMPDDGVNPSVNIPIVYVLRDLLIGDGLMNDDNFGGLCIILGIMLVIALG